VPLGRREVALQEGVERTVSALDASLSRPVRHASRPEYQRLPIDEVKPDPDQLRWGGRPGLTWEDVKDPERKLPPYLAKVRESIYELAGSVGPDGLGQKDAVRVWRAEGFWQLATGERRYWALRLADVPFIDAMVYAERPRYLRSEQYSENYEHLPPDFREELFGLQQVIQERVELNEPFQDCEHFRKIMGMGRSKGYRWWSVLEGPPEVREAIIDQRLESLKIASAIAAEENPELRAQMLVDPKQYFSSDGTRLQSAATAPPTPDSTDAAPKRTAGRPQQYISWKTTSLPLVQTVIYKLDPKARNSSVNWQDPRAVAKLWRDTLKKIEGQLAKAPKE
jgi:hypothetical protein